MNSKKAWIWFAVGAVWLAGLIGSFAYASQSVGDDLKKGLIWFGISLLWGCLGVFGAIKLNKKR